MIKSESYCFKISANETDTIRVSFTISGKGEDKCRTQFFNPQKVVINDYSGKRHGFLSHKAETPGIYQICFSRMDMNIKKVSLNLNLIKDYEKPTEKAKEQDVGALVGRLNTIRQDLNRVSENMMRMQQSELTHQNMMNRSRKSVRWFTFLKIAIVVIIAIFQA